QGYARSASSPPNIACNATFDEAQQKAATSQLGLWNTPVTVTLDLSNTLECIRRSGLTDLCVAGQGLASNPELLEIKARKYCEDKNQNESKGYCFIMICKDESNVPQFLPMTDDEAKTQIAQYTKNPTTGYDCFLTLNNNEITFRSSGCQ